MPKELANGKPTTRRYSDEEKAAAVRMVRTLRAELGVTQGTVQRVATQLGYGVESVRMWVKQADIDEGVTSGVSSAEAQRVKELEQEVRELRRAARRARHRPGRAADAAATGNPLREGRLTRRSPRPTTPFSPRQPRNRPETSQPVRGRPPVMTRFPWPRPFWSSTMIRPSAA